MMYLLLLLLTLPCFAVTPPHQDVIDKYVDLATRIDPEKIKNLKGHWVCLDAINHQDEARGRTQEEAITGHQLLCIRKQCETLGSRVLESGKQLKEMPEEDLRDFLEFNGYSKEEIDQKVSLLKSSSPEKEQVQNCRSGSALFRMTAFDSCFSLPVECYKD